MAKQQKGTVTGKKSGKHIKQVQNQKALSFPGQAKGNTAKPKDPTLPSTGDPLLLSEALTEEAAARRLPDESDEELLEPDTKHIKAVFSTSKLLSPTDSALVNLSTADFAEIKMEKMEDESIQERSTPSREKSPETTQDTEVLFDAFGPGAESSPERSISTIFQGIYDESSEEERDLLNTISGFVSAPTSAQTTHIGTLESPVADFMQPVKASMEASHPKPVINAQVDSTHAPSDSQKVTTRKATPYFLQRIGVQNMGSHLVIIELAADDTGHSLKLELAGRCGISIEDFHLTHENLDIDSDRTLQESGLRTEDIVLFSLLSTPPSNPLVSMAPFSHSPVIAVQSFPMTLSTHMAETPFYVSPVETLAGLQAKVHGITGCQANMQMLTYGGARIESDLANHHYPIQSGERIYLRVRTAPRLARSSDEDSDSEYSTFTDSVPEMCSGDISVISGDDSFSDENFETEDIANIETANTFNDRKRYHGKALEDGEIPETLWESNKEERVSTGEVIQSLVPVDPDSQSPVSRATSARLGDNF